MPSQPGETPLRTSTPETGAPEKPMLGDQIPAPEVIVGQGERPAAVHPSASREESTTKGIDHMHDTEGYNYKRSRATRVASTLLLFSNTGIGWVGRQTRKLGAKMHMPVPKSEETDLRTGGAVLVGAPALYGTYRAIKAAIGHFRPGQQPSNRRQRILQTARHTFSSRG